jgi:putative transposase
MSTHYPTDLTDEQWNILRPLILLPEGGRRRTTDLRQVINAILYQAKTGCQWRFLPHDFPPEGTVRRYLHYLKRTNQLERINECLRKQVRVQEGRNEEPSLGIVDSQSVKAAGIAEEKGFDAGKKIKGIKRHILVDILGLIICVVVHAANIQEREGAKFVLAKAAKQNLTRMKKILGDGGYTGEKMQAEAAKYGWDFEAVKRTDLHKFVVQPRRWVVERTFGWMMNWRSLCRHYDYDSRTSETKMLLASVYYMTKRLTKTAIKNEINSLVSPYNLNRANLLGLPFF